jgi:hypothetical protein
VIKSCLYSEPAGKSRTRRVPHVGDVDQQAAVKAAEISREATVKGAEVSARGSVRTARTTVIGVVLAAVITGTCGVTGVGVQGYFNLQVARLNRPTAAPTAVTAPVWVAGEYIYGGTTGYWYRIEDSPFASITGVMPPDYPIGAQAARVERVPTPPRRAESPGASSRMFSGGPEEGSAAPR